MIKRNLFNLFFLTLLNLAFFSRLFSLGNINPNLPLIFFLIYFNLPSHLKPNQNEFLLLLFFFLVSSFLFSSFFFNKEMIEAILIFLLYFLSQFFTFNWLLDGFILLVIFETFFWSLAFIFNHYFPIMVILKELFYNYFLFLVFQLILKSKKI